jgi:hypothetical protein
LKHGTNILIYTRKRRFVSGYGLSHIASATLSIAPSGFAAADLAYAVLLLFAAGGRDLVADPLCPSPRTEANRTCFSWSSYGL